MCKTRTLNDESPPDFIVTQPSASSSWANGSPYPLSWSKGLLDGVDSFDIELTRLNENGIYWVAKNGEPRHTSSDAPD